MLLSRSSLFTMNEGELLSFARRFSKCENDYIDEHVNTLDVKKIAVLSSYTTHHLITVLKLFLYNEKISPISYEGEFNSISYDLLDPNSELFAFKPDILLILTTHRDIRYYPPLFASDDEVSSWIAEYVGYYTNLWKCASKIEGCQIIQTNFVLPIYRQLGNMEVNYAFSNASCLNELNLSLTKEKAKNVTLFDVEFLASYVGKSKWFDDKGYFLSKQGFSFSAYGIVCDELSKVISNSICIRKKCIVLDLDNTLWGGVIGDDGLDGINLNPGDPVGEAFIAFQKYVKSLKERGVILAVCSKNDEENAKLPFNHHPDMILSLDEISCFVANWDDKATNIRKICDSLHISVDSIVFFDDNPFEREIVKNFIPEVEVIEVSKDPALYVKDLDSARCFEWCQLTEEDTMRTESFVADCKRNEIELTAIDYDSYLKQLDMHANIGFPSDFDLPRFTQLINKSNQFNLRTIRYSDAMISQMRSDTKNYSLICASLSDKFGKYGIISCVILAKLDSIAFIDTWVMSCRVLKRGVELATFNAICEYAIKWGCDCVVGEYIPTKKNEMVSSMLPDLGFLATNISLPTSITPVGKLYMLNMIDFEKIKHYISVCENW